MNVDVSPLQLNGVHILHHLVVLVHSQSMMNNHKGKIINNLQGLGLMINMQKNGSSILMDMYLNSPAGAFSGHNAPACNV